MIIILALNSRAASDTIMWSNQRLKAINFKGNSDTVTYNRNHFATTLWKMTWFYRKDAAARQVEVIAYAWFDGRRSWIRASQKTNVALLLHEQGHFDLAEILARRFRKKISETSFSSGGYGVSLQAIFSELLTETYALQERYDAETQYGEIPSKQREWQNYISTTLTSLQAFSDKNIIGAIR